MKYVLFPFIAYVIAAPLTSRISLDIKETHWNHVATYAWWLGTYFALASLWIVALLIVVAYYKVKGE